MASKIMSRLCGDVNQLMVVERQCIRTLNGFFSIKNLQKNNYSSNVNISHNEESGSNDGFSKEKAQELLLRLNPDERTILLDTIHEYESKLIRNGYEGQLASGKWRSKFGRPSKVPYVGEVDATGSYCPVPEEWLKEKWVENAPKPTKKNLLDIAIVNSIPFIGFGFLDNFFMLIAGDYIDLYLGSYLCISTMTAAALGNTISDILGIGSAFYVESFATRIGHKPPKLSPIQMKMSSVRNAANLGRVLGVSLGCILGMFPLLFKKSSRKEESENVEKVA